MPVLRPPLTPADARALRAAVLARARTDPRGRLPPALHVGVPGGPVATVADDPAWDHGLRAEIAGALLRALDDPPWVWVGRSGPLCAQDVDMAWLGPAVAAAGERGVDVAFVVVTRHGWADPRSGLRREWRRIRQR